MNLMSPLTLLQRPIRWLQAVTRWRATVSGGPNFAFDLAVSRTTPEQRAGLRLDTLDITFCGAEPIRADTVDRFCEAFAPAGFRRESFHPCYGLAESTLIVTGGGCGAPVLFEADAEALEQRRARRADARTEQTRRLVGSGRPVHRLQVAIVDPDTRERVPDGSIGEIWISGPSVARGYWNRPEETERLFHARIAATGEGPFLRTGDLGFLDAGELFVTGRIKHLIIIDGRNRPRGRESGHRPRRPPDGGRSARRAGARRRAAAAGRRAAHEQRKDSAQRVPSCVRVPRVPRRPRAVRLHD